MNARARERGERIRSCLIGYAAALALTGAAFALVQWRFLGPAATLGVVFGLGLMQIIAHFRFFLHVGLGRGSRDALLILLFSAAILSLMVGGTLILLFNLHQRMM